MVKSYEELEVWQLAMTLSESIYKLTECFPQSERYRLVDQMCRAAISIPSNIAEGNMRHTTKDYLRFISMAQGSIAEIETQLMLSQRLEYADSDSIERTMALARRVGKMLNSMSISLQRKLSPETISHQPRVTSHP